VTHVGCDDGIVLETERLVLRKITLDDAAFILELVNDPSFLRYIGDKRVRTIEDAREYISRGPVDSYRRHGFGLYLTELKQDSVPIGICGLVKRDTLEDPDIGFAFLPRFWAKGYAIESASAVLAHALDFLKLVRILAIASPDNHASIRVLAKLGLRFDRNVRLSEDGTELALFTSSV
jgi:RimJ/RimL family protein N-acetyltransferase